MQKMSNDTMECVMHMLPFQSRMQLAQTCRNNYYVADRPSAWKHLPEAENTLYPSKQSCLARAGLISLSAHEPVRCVRVGVELRRWSAAYNKFKSDYRFEIWGFWILLVLFIAANVYIVHLRVRILAVQQRHGNSMDWYMDALNREYERTKQALDKL
jgi:hypothetical protein